MVPSKTFPAQKLYKCTTNTWQQLMEMIKCVLILLFAFKQRNGPLRIFFFRLERSIVNAHIGEWESTSHTPRIQLEFRVDLAHKLVENYNERKDQGRPRIHPLESRFTERHFPEHVPYNKKGRPKERECAVCKAGGQVKRCSFMFQDCNV